MRFPFKASCVLSIAVLGSVVVAQTVLDQLKGASASRTARTVECFDGFTNKDTMIQVAAKCGVPDEERGSGIDVFVYRMSDGSIVTVSAAGIRQPILSIQHCAISVLKQSGIQDELGDSRLLCTTLRDLVANPRKYDGKFVQMRAWPAMGWEGDNYLFE